MLRVSNGRTSTSEERRETAEERNVKKKRCRRALTRWFVDNG